MHDSSLQLLRDVIEDGAERVPGRNRIAIVVWHKDGDNEHRVELALSPIELITELEDALRLLQLRAGMVALAREVGDALFASLKEGRA